MLKNSLFIVLNLILSSLYNGSLLHLFRKIVNVYMRIHKIKWKRIKQMIIKSLLKWKIIHVEWQDLKRNIEKQKIFDVDKFLNV